ncbi:DUF7286 family protein [Halosimplex sp. J119]
MGGKGVVSIASSERARIPFALIGVFLLLGSSMLVAAFQTRPEPQVNVDVSETIDRAAASAQGELRESLVTASERAAREPMTRAADTEFGRVLADGDPDAADRETVFVRYVKLLVYMQAHEQVTSVDQPVGDETRARVSLSPVTDASDAAAAIDAVTLHVGGEDLSYGDSYTDSLGHGKVRATIDGVSMEAVRDGEVVASDTRPVTVTVGTPLFQLYHRTTMYERQLNMDFGNAGTGEYEGLGKYLGGRLAALSYTRGYAQNEGAPVREVVAQRHVETMANDAIFATQRRVFGHEDRRSTETLARSYACMLGRDTAGIYETANGGSDDVDALLDEATDRSYCQGANEIYGDSSVSFDSAPSWRQLASDTAYLDQRETVGLDETAEVVFGEAAVEDAVETAIDRVYTVDVGTDASVETTVRSGDEDDENEQLLRRDVMIPSVERVADPDSTSRERDLYEVHVVFVGMYERGGTESTVRYDVDLTVTGEHSPDALTRDAGIDYDYESGPYGADDTVYGSNYADVPETAAEATLEGVTDADRIRTQLKSHIESETTGSHSVLDSQDLLDVITAGDAEVRAEPTSPDVLKGWLVEDLIALEEDVSTVSTTFPRHELLDDGSPFRALRQQIDDDHDDAYVYPYLDGEYENVPDKVRAEARLEMLNRLRTRVDEAIEQHELRKTRLDETLDGYDGTDLSDLTAFTRRQLGPSPREVPPADVPESELLREEITVADGEPTHLTFDRVQHEQVPAVDDPTHGFAPLSGAEENYYTAPEAGEGSRASGLVTAGKVLQAGKATDSVVGGDWDDGNVDALEDGVETELDRIAASAATSAARVFPLGSDELETAIREEMRELGSTETQAIRMGENETARAVVASAVSDRFRVPEDSEYDYLVWQFNSHLEGTIKYGLDRSTRRVDVTSSPLAPATQALGERVRGRLDEVDDDVVSERLASSLDRSLDARGTTATEEQWLRSDLDENAFAPNRAPSGTHLIDVPKWNVLTANRWDIRVRGQYKRFVAESSVSTPRSSTPMRFVRERDTVSIDVDGSTVRLGRTESISFDARAPLVVAAPSDGLGVGDRTATPDLCFGSSPVTGPVRDESDVDDCADP